MIVDDEEKLSQRVWSGWDSPRPKQSKTNSPKQEITSWRNFKAHEQRPGDIVVLNLEATGAPTLQEAIKLRETQPKLKFFYVINVSGSLSKRTLTALSQPDIAWVSSEASDQEMQLRLRGMIKRSTPRPLLKDPSRSPWTLLMPDLHNPESGRLDAARTAEWFGMPLKTLAGLLGRGYATVHKTPDSTTLQESLKVFLRVASALSKLAGSHERAKAWLNTPSQDLDDHQTPLSAIALGDQEIIAELLEDALVGQPG
ncbi:MAG: hypothetical protein ABIY70_06695 [Capsulimonas sp.]|uniref:hypothetical protein n=1 Tax=Capsulimonas sp. TaxID=2494211 RepID=UPI003263EBDC